MNDYIVTSSVVKDSFNSLWGSVAGFLPRFIVAIVVFIIGWLVAIVIGKLVWHLVKFLQLDRGLESVGFKKAWERSGHKLDSAFFFYELVKWFVIVLSLMIASDILGLSKVTDFLTGVVNYLPNVFIAAIVLVIGVLVARFAEHAVRGSVKAAELHSANFLGSITRWAIMVFSLIVALDRLQILGYVLPAAITGLIAALALAFGLAFGLGGRDHADEWLTNWKKHIQD